MPWVLLSMDLGASGESQERVQEGFELWAGSGSYLEILPAKYGGSVTGLVVGLAAQAVEFL